MEDSYNLKDLDPSCNTDVDLRDCFGREKQMDLDLKYSFRRENLPHIT